eukprot:TRINITY_DN100520_c0_g1_i1.p1 TRINITY_DN100520_c0_g1~~TRINITY_DN100520_c0_g1_i1.p1  ORF type:complete len:536 (+),score=80.90 TRINITY_DN100520_c0_g1_i1:125-1609(+)
MYGLQLRAAVVSLVAVRWLAVDCLKVPTEIDDAVFGNAADVPPDVAAALAVERAAQKNLPKQIHSSFVNPDDAAGVRILDAPRHSAEWTPKESSSPLDSLSVVPDSGMAIADNLSSSLPEYRPRAPVMALLLVCVLLFLGLARCWHTGLLGRGGVEQPGHQVVWTLCICSLFMLVGPSLMMMNKHIMQVLGFEYPMALSSLGLVVSSIFVRLGTAFGVAPELRRESREVVAGHRWFTTAFPIGFAKALTLALGNCAYLYLGLGFIQMLKAFTPCLVLVGMKLAGVSTPSHWAVVSIGVIVFGTTFEVTGNMNVTMLGLAIILGSEFFEALNLVLTQVLLQDCKFTITEGLYVLAPVAGGCLLALSALFELPKAIERGAWRIPYEHPHYFLAVGLLGFLVNFLAFAVVQATSSLTLKILNVIRCVGVVIVSVVFYHEVLSRTQLVGYSITLVGFVGYNFAQFLQPAARDDTTRSSLCKGGPLCKHDETLPLMKQR